MPLTDLQKLGAGGMKLTFDVDGAPREMTLRPLTLSDLVEYETNIGPIEDLGSQFSSMRGMRFLLWCGLRKEQPDLTIEQAGGLFGPRDIDRLVELVSFLMAQEADPKGEAPGDAAGAPTGEA